MKEFKWIFTKICKCIILLKSIDISFRYIRCNITCWSLLILFLSFLGHCCGHLTRLSLWDIDLCLSVIGNHSFTTVRLIDDLFVLKLLAPPDEYLIKWWNDKSVCEFKINCPIIPPNHHWVMSSVCLCDKSGFCAGLKDPCQVNDLHATSNSGWDNWTV